MYMHIFCNCIGIQPITQLEVYGASKSGVVGFTRSLKVIRSVIIIILCVYGGLAIRILACCCE